MKLILCKNISGPDADSQTKRLEFMVFSETFQDEAIPDESN